MIKRPKSSEGEEDILRMQDEYLTEKRKNQNLQPAAQVVNLRRTEPTKRANTNESSIRKLSRYAQAKGLKDRSGKRDCTKPRTSSVVADILEKNLVESPQNTHPDCGDDKVYYPQVIGSVLGNIIEKDHTDYEHFNSIPMPSEGFPTVTKRDPIITNSKKNALKQHLNRSESGNTNLDLDEPSCSTTCNQDLSKNINLPSKSYIVSSNEACDIHNENIKKLTAMSEMEILDEQKNLLKNLDSNLINFIKGKRQKADVTQENKSFDNKSIKIIEEMDTSLPSNVIDNRHLWDNDVLSHPEVDKWLNFDSLEKDKFEWMKSLEESKNMKADQPYEARFDFNGYLLSYTMEYNEKTKTLFHHGEEPHRPGYTLTELIQLSRSTITQQRVMALNTIAGILEYHTAGTYKDIIEIPLSKIFFVIRIAMDENKAMILEPALKAMRNLLYNRIDEVSLDSLLGLEEGTLQPCLENDKSEIVELETSEADLNDFHLAEIDLIKALLRTDILQRLSYIVETIKPGFNCVHYALQILIRLARDSIETATKIVQTEHLMKTIFKYFIPITGINFAFDAHNVYNGKPVLAALKLLRILSLQSEEISIILLTKYDILKPISEYISSVVERTHGLRIQIEAYSLLSNLLQFNLGIANTISLCPVIITSLYKHVKETDIFVNTPITTVTHAAVVLQLINKLLSCNLNCIDNYKSQIYQLLKEGVQKWIRQLTNADYYTCGHLHLLCAALDCCKTILIIENVSMEFLNNSIQQLSSSQGINEIMKHTVPSSNLLSGYEHKDLHLTRNLMSLGASLVDSAHKVLPMLNVASPIPFLTSFCKLILCINDKRISEAFLKHIAIYLKKLANNSPMLCDNWFSRMETDFLFNALKLSTQSDITEEDKDLLYIIANKLCYILRIDKKHELEFLFDKIVFNKDWFTAGRLLNLVNLTNADSFSKALTSIDVIKACYSKVTNLNYNPTGPNILMKWREPLLPRDWIYLPILTLYSKSQEAETTSKVFGEHTNKVMAQIAAHKEFIISSSLEWILFNELCFPDLLDDIVVTDRLCRIMCVFLCDNSLFLDAKINMLLQKCTQIMFKKNSTYNFDRELTGLSNFQDFYTQFLEQFQSVSYGDHTFAACVLVPLAQRHNVKWRKILWSEYAGCLRALDCPEELLCYELKDYLYPEESDESLIKCYIRALSNNLVRPNTIAYKIAYNHVQHFKKRTSHVTA